MFDFLGCTIHVEPQQMSAVVRTESSANPYAIGIVGHRLSRQPSNAKEALDVVATLKDGKYNFSVGIAQVNQSNFARYGLDTDNMFDTCTNLRVGSLILKECHDRLKDWPQAYSCYYSGNAVTGFRHGYVGKVLRHLDKPLLTSVSIPKADGVIRILPRKVQGSTDKAGAKTAKAVLRAKTLRERRLSSPLTPK